MKYIFKNALPALLIAAVMLSGCDKTKMYDTVTADPQVHFTGDEIQIYSMLTNPAAPYIVTIGTTNVSDVDRTVTFKVISTSGATAGNEYTLGVTGNTVVIPAGKATVNIPVNGNYSKFSAGEKDTLIFSLQEPSLKVAGFQDSVTLILRGPCFDGVDINDPATLQSMVGNYLKTTDAGFGPWGPYTSRIKSITTTSATTADAVIANVWDAGLGDVTFVINWTNPAAVTINVKAATITGGDAGALNPAYDGMFLVIRKHASANGSFSVCAGNAVLRYQFGVYDPATSSLLGYFGTVGITNLIR